MNSVQNLLLNFQITKFKMPFIEWLLSIRHCSKRGFLVAQMVKTPVQSLSQEDPLKKRTATHSSILGLPYGSDSKEPACNVGAQGLIPGLGRSPGEGNGSPFQYSCLGNPTDRGAWWATVHEVAILTPYNNSSR